MDQYYKLFGTCRIPQKQKDQLKVMQVYNINYEKVNHITVMINNKVKLIYYKKNHFVKIFVRLILSLFCKIFKLEIIDPKTGVSRTPGEMFKALKHLASISKQPAPIGLGIFTGENRDVWADVYSKLNKS
jgi:hypothetical protein